MKIKKNGKVITLTESDLKRIVKRTLSEQETDDIPSTPPKIEPLISAIVRFHPELKSMQNPSVGDAVHHIFVKEGGFSVKNMKEVCDDAPEFCKVAFRMLPEVMEEIFKII